MVQRIKFNGEEVAIDFSLRTVSMLAKEYGVDITGLAEMVMAKAESVDDILELAERLGVLALNDGAERTGSERIFTKFDMRDAITADAGLCEQLLTMLMTSFEQAEVFPTPPSSAAKKPKKK